MIALVGSVRGGEDSGERSVLGFPVWELCVCADIHYGSAEAAGLEK